MSGAPRPGIVWIQGGGWRNKAGEGKVLWRHAAHLAALGYPGANLTYRLAPGHRFPAQLDDVRAGVRWVRRHAAELGIDPQRLGAAGESAGGHLAALLATTDAPQDGVGTRVQALVGEPSRIDPEIDFALGGTDFRGDIGSARLIGDVPARDVPLDG